MYISAVVMILIICNICAPFIDWITVIQMNHGMGGGVSKRTSRHGGGEFAVIEGCLPDPVARIRLPAPSFRTDGCRTVSVVNAAPAQFCSSHPAGFCHRRLTGGDRRSPEG